MNSKTLGIIIGVIAVVAIGIAVAGQGDNNSNAPSSTSTASVQNTNSYDNDKDRGRNRGRGGDDNDNNVPAQPATGATMTSAEVAVHNSRTDCYSIIRGKVYNLTSWISQHPGGANAIIQLCGKDGTAIFESQHAGQANPEARLATFFIANLAQ